MTFVPITYKGGVYKHDIILDLIDDLGGHIVQKHMIAQDVVLQCLVPKEDIPLIKETGRPFGSEVFESPLVGTEIAVISPSLEIHHLPHTSCDVAEYLRSAGAKTNMIGLARGFGKRIANLNIEERDIINEHDCAVLMLGNFESCIRHKIPALRRGIKVPIILTGGPDTESLSVLADPPLDGYVGNIGRIEHRMKKQECEIEYLDELVDVISGVLDKKREEIAKNPLSISPAKLMSTLDEEMQITKGSTHPTPITVQTAGLRVKIPYGEYADDVSAVEIEDGVKIGDICDISPSRMRNYIWVKIKPFSETNIMV